MRYYPNYADSRLLEYCIYCGKEPNSKEHVPPKSLLDEPYPEQLPTVGSCKNCNNRFSIDEEYLSCAVEYARCGSAKSENLMREKIKRKLRVKKSLIKRIRSGVQQSSNGMRYLRIEKPRIKDVITKICQGHAAYELSEVFLGIPSKIRIKPLVEMSPDEMKTFETPIKNTVFPEVGSRFTQKLLILSAGTYSYWIPVQDGQYRFMVGIAEEEIIVKVVISEYLACEVVWGDNRGEYEPEEDIPELWAIVKLLHGLGVTS